MTTLSDIILPSALLTVDNTKTVTNKTISGASNTIENLNASNLSSGTVATARLASGTASSSTYLRGDQTWAAAGLNYFSDAESTASPNNTVYVDSLSATGASTNVDVDIVPKGAGAFLLQVPDGTVTGGNKRGAYAVDLQMVRAAATEVASGSYSFVAGRLNTASATYGVVLGYNNTVSGPYGVALGANQGVAGTYGVALGNGNSASNTSAVAAGYACIASAPYAIGMGYSATADGYYSAVVGYSGDARARYSVLNIGARTPTGSGFSSASIFTVGNTTTDATPTVLSAASTVSESAWNLMDVYSAYALKILVVGMSTGGSYETKSWEISALVKRATGQPSIVGGITKNVVAADSGTSSWDVDLVMSSTTAGFSIQVTGAASTTIRWTGSMYSAEYSA